MKKSLSMFAAMVLLAAKISFATLCSDVKVDTVIFNAPAITCEDFPIQVVVHNHGTSTYTGISLGLKFYYDSTVTATPSGSHVGVYHLYTISSLSGGAYDTLSLVLHYGCSAINQFALVETFSATVLDYAGIYVGGSFCDSLLFTYALLSPKLNAAAPDVLHAFPGSISRTLNVKNTGAAYFDHYFAFKDSLDATAASFMHITGADVYIGNTLINSLTLGSPGDSIRIVFNPVSDTIFTGDTLKIIEHFFVFGCPVGSQTFLQYVWGCDSCKTESYALSVNTITPTKNVEITRLLPNPNIAENVWDNSCVNEIVHWKYQLVNNGSGFNNVHVYIKHKGTSDQPYYTYVLSNAPYPITCSRAHTDSIVMMNTLSYYTAPDTVNCLLLHPDAVFYEEMNIGFLSAGDTFYVDFYTVRCCANDENIDSTALSEFDVFNKNKYFNHWLLDVQGQDNCGHALERISNPVQRSLYSAVAISSHTGFSDEIPDLSMTQEYFPVISDLSVPHNDTLPPDQHCATPQEFTVNNIQFDDFSRARFDQQLFQGTDSMAPTGRFRVIIQFQPGLHFDTAALHAPYMFCALLGYTWNSTGSFSAITSPAGIGEAWEGFFDFDTTNFQDYTKLMTIMNFSQFHFWIKGCCDAIADPVKFDVKFYLDPLPKPSCTDCYVPMTRTTGNLHIHCPGCITPGIETTSFTLLRQPASFGLYDRDNDGLADSTLQQISVTDTVAMSHIRRNASTAGDLLMATMRGTFHDGANTTHHNLTYGAYLVHHSPFKYLYLEQLINYSESSRFDLSIDSAKLIIQSVFCGCNINYSLHSYEIIRHDSSYFYKIAADSIAGYTIKEGDNFELQSYFNVCNNYQPGNSWAAVDSRFDADPIGCMYFSDTSLSGITYFHHPANIYTAGDGYNLLCSPTDPNLCGYSADTLEPDWLYFCGANGSTHRFYSIRTGAGIQTSNTLPNGTVCDKILTFSNLAAIGGYSANVFPFEYRSAYDPAYMPVPQFQATIPAGYHSNRFRQEVDYHTYLPGCAYYNEHNEVAIGYTAPLTGSQNFSIPNFDYATESIPLSLDSICNPVHQVTPASMFYIGDEYFKEIYTIYMYPDCSVQTCSTAVTNISVSYTIFGCNLHDTMATYNVDSLSMPFLYDATNSCMIDTQLLILTPPNPITVAQHRVKFKDLQLNVYDSNNPNICIWSPNTWIYVPDTSFLDSMLITCTTSGCPLYHDTVPANANGFFQLGDLACGLQCSYDLIANYVRCEGEGDHSLPIYYGWNCGPCLNIPSNRPDTDSIARYPLALGSACGQYPADSLHIHEVDIQFIPHDDLTYTEPSTFTICDTSEIEECVRSNQGGVENLIAYIDLHDTLLLLDTASVQLYYYNNTSHVHVSPVSVSAGIYSVDLSSYNTFLSATSHQLDSGKYICIRYRVIPQCGYNPAQMPEVNFGGIAFCGDTIPASVGDTLANWTFAGDSCHCPALFTVDVGRDSLICDSSCVTLTATIGGIYGGLQYLWMPGALSDDNPTVCPDTTTTYILTVTDTLRGTSMTDSITINVINTTLGCCIPPGFQSGFDYNFTGVHSSTLPFDTINTNNIVLINDTFTVDSNFTIRGCPHVILGPDAVINVLPNITFNVWDSHFYSCSEMWNAINVRTTGKVSIKSSRIEDGDSAVFCDGGGTIEILSSTFNRNYYDVVMQNGGGWVVNIERDSFLCDSNVLLKAPHSGKRTEMHIKVFKISPLIVIGATNGNYFSNGDYGIYSERSTVIGFYNTFEDFLSFHGVKTTAVFARNNALLGLGTYGAGNIFRRCESAVRTINSPCNAVDNSMDDVYTGFNCSNNSGITLNIQSNHITKAKFGIFSSINPFGNISIAGNDVATVPVPTGGTSYAIYVSDLGYADAYNCSVFRNVVNSQSTYGIYSSGMNGVKIYENTVSLLHAAIARPIAYGIRSDASKKGLYEHNCVKRFGDRRNTRGIAIADCYQSSVYCNTTDSTEWGLQFIGTCDFSWTKGNTITNHKQGFVLGELSPLTGTKIADQVSFIEGIDTFIVGNNFPIGTNDSDSYTYKLTSLADVPVYWYNGFGAFNDRPFRNGNFALSNPLAPTFNPSFQPYDSCDPPCQINHPIDDDPKKKPEKDQREQLAQDSINDTEDGDQVWKAKKTLFEDLKLDSGLIDSSSILEVFYDTTEIDPIGELTNAKNAIIAVFDTLIQTDSIEKADRFSEAMTINSSITPQLTPEDNEKIVNAIFLSATSEEWLTYTTYEILQLEEVANQCPYTGGFAVYQARTLLKNYDLGYSFDDSLACSSYSLRTAKPYQRLNDKKVEVFKVYPNPTSGTLTIESVADKNGKVRLCILNTLNVPVEQKSLEMAGKISQVDISKLPSGVYEFQLSIDNQLEQTGKIVLIK